jgi:N-acetylmuramoyl-L-alanine amidase
MGNFHWVIDPGHGDQTKDKHSPPFTDGSVYNEYEFNYAVVEYLTGELARSGVSFHLTNSSPAGVGNSLAKRVHSANSFQTLKPKILVSIHSNLCPPIHTWQNEESGVEVWYPNKSFFSKSLAKDFLRSISYKNGLKWRGVKYKTANQYFLLMNTDMPSVVLEIGFLNNFSEVKLLADPGFQEVVAESIADVIRVWDNRALT